MQNTVRVGRLHADRRGGAASQQQQRQQRRNAVDGATAEAFREGLEEFEADDGARVLVLTGAGGQAFCAGADLKAMDLNVDHPDGPMGPTRLTPAKPAIAAVGIATRSAVSSAWICAVVSAASWAELITAACAVVSAAMPAVEILARSAGSSGWSTRIDTASTSSPR